MAEHTPDLSIPLQAAADLSASLAQAAQKNRALLEEMTHFTQAEMLRFFQQRLDRDNAVLGKLQDAQGIGGIIGVQQEWLRELFQDCLGQNMRLADMMGGMTRDAFDCCSRAVDIGAGKAQEMAEDMAEMPARMAEDAQYAETQH
jgi:hypothetical protein